MSHCLFCLASGQLPLAMRGDAGARMMIRAFGEDWVNGHGVCASCERIAVQVVRRVNLGDEASDKT